MKKDTVNHILEVGTDLFLKNGYGNVGLNRILDTAGIPKGSFYYYFKSKEDFGLQVIRFYSENSLVILKSYLTNTTMDPKTRILSFFKDMRDVYAQKGFTEGCLLGNCSIELSDVSSAFSAAVADELDRWQYCFEDCIAAGQEDGSIKKDKSAQDMAAYILSGWEGALLRMKSSKKPDAIDVFVEFITKYIL